MYDVKGTVQPMPWLNLQFLLLWIERGLRVFLSVFTKLFYQSNLNAT
jgi:hypothetical protein